MKNVYIKNDDDFYKNIKKYKNKDVILHFCYDNKDIIDDKEIESKYSNEIKNKIYLIQAVNIKNLRKRYLYVYDLACNYLDKEFNDKNICSFKDDSCVAVRNNSYCQSLNGCCYGTKRGLCKNFKNGECSIKAISCKLFTCRYLRHHNIKYKVNDIVLLKYLFNGRQKYIIENSLFKGREEIIDLLIKNK